MPDPKNPRIAITPEGYQALCIQAALEMLLQGPSGLTKMILSQAQDALQDSLQVTRMEALPHKEPQQRLSESKASKK